MKITFHLKGDFAVYINDDILINTDDLDYAAEFAMEHWVEGHGDICTIVDNNTREPIITFEDEDNDSEDWGYNEDMGFDPYLGCYTDEC